ncbi:MAG: structural protein P5 [Bacteroidaceae bacterium]|nr:structural protein P5 [Bacteroidaceae bacterium]
MVSLGIRNNNPLNIRYVPTTRWLGELSKSESAESAFCCFVSMEWGIRAACCILRTYAKRYKAVCIRDIVRRWAPPSENDTERYIRNVCLWTGFGGNERLTERDWPLLIRAMARQECGVILDDATIVRGFCLYLTQKSQK